MSFVNSNCGNGGYIIDSVVISDYVVLLPLCDMKVVVLLGIVFIFYSWANL
jgi:hypothetical protein